MATALVSGCAAVVREALIQQRQTAPNAALVKAVLICGAEDLPRSGSADRGNRGNRVNRVNRVNLANSVVICRHRTFEENNLRQGAQVSYPVAKDGKPAALKVVLVWVDYPGAALQSQLGLNVRVDAEHLYSRLDPYDNVLEVRADRRSSSATISILAHRITRTTDMEHPRYQAFALAWRWLPI
ncbi:hypothetical protein QQX98_013346 [Neonectria punicea]|uniref:Uncharacterized protein n=1 Tax=Neonectria punicea TaxID=979145 RepID=A0ABR1GGK5_9HYPO